MTTVYPRKYCCQFCGSRYWEAFQAAVYFALALIMSVVIYEFQKPYFKSRANS